MTFENLFESVITSGSLQIKEFAICTLASLVLGALIALSYAINNKHFSRSFLMTMAVLPVAVQAIISMMTIQGTVGAGIAVALVATIYGLFAANLLMIPLSTRIKFIYQNVFLYKNIILEGVLSIQAGESPVLIERKLRSFILETNTETKE